MKGLTERESKKVKDEKKLTFKGVLFMTIIMIIAIVISVIQYITTHA